MSNLIRIHDEDNFMVDYDNKDGQYRVSYFKDGHFKDECWFSNPHVYVSYEAYTRLEYLKKKLNKTETEIIDEALAVYDNLMAIQSSLRRPKED
jgi:hypothetical protein